MLPVEGLTDIVENPISENGEDLFLELDDDLDDELDPKINQNLISRKSSSRPDTTVSTGESQHGRSKYSYQPLYGYGGSTLKRDPIIESIIDSRKSVVIENAYTQLAQIKSQAFRSSLQAQNNSFKPHAMKSNNDTINQVEKKENYRTLSLVTLPLDNDQWDDGLNKEDDKESIASADKSSIQVYEETCKRLNICPCSVIIRSLYTTHINLQNYGLGTKGSAALAVALVRNTSVLSLNLSGNNIGNDGMSHIYQILTENAYVEEYDLSNNSLGTKGIHKLAAGAASCVLLKSLNVAGNDFTASDINILLTKLEDHQNLKDLNISHNQLDEEGGIYVAKWLSDNSVLTNLDVSWCSIRLMGARAIAKAIGDNNKLLKLNLSNNSFANDTVEHLTNSFTRNSVLKDLNLSSNEFFCRYDIRIKDDPSILITGKEAFIYKMFVAAATNQALQIFRLGKNHIDARCIMIILESLSKLDNLSLEELDLTGLSLTSKQVSDIEKMFMNQSKLTCYVGPIRKTVEQYANNLLNSIQIYCQKHHVDLSEIFNSNDDKNMPNFILSYNQFLNRLKKAKISFPVAQIENIMKYLGRDDDDGTISLGSLEVV